MERWKDVPGFEGFYEVSNLGRVKSINREVKHREHLREHLRKIAERILRPTSNGHGYLQVDLYANGGHKMCKVHRLVLLAFVGPAPEGEEARHLNGDPKDNRLCNLTYGTSSENTLDCYRYGKQRLHKLSVSDVRAIRTLLKSGRSYAEIARKYGVTRSSIGQIKLGKSFGWLD